MALRQGKPRRHISRKAHLLYLVSGFSRTSALPELRTFSPKICLNTSSVH